MDKWACVFVSLKNIIRAVTVSSRKSDPRSVVLNIVDCDTVVSEFKFKSRYCVHFRTNTLWKNYEPSDFPGATTVLLQEWLWHYITQEASYTMK